ncbi:hypothetical protein V8F20_000967 [Naviculisporaceae sp. PSN 640]
MRIATPTLKCRVRPSYLAPSTIHLRSGRHLQAESFRIVRPNLGYPDFRLPRHSSSSTTTVWFKTDGSAREDLEPLADGHDTLSSRKRSSWSFIRWVKTRPHEASPYGKWDWLREDEERLRYEADILSDERRETRLVDLPGNYNDVNLWTCILDFLVERDGQDGVLTILKGLLDRRSLVYVGPRATERFWAKILATALEDDYILDHVWAYAEYMYEDHAVKWPDLYSTVISACLEQRHVDKAILWDERLRRYWGLGSSGSLELVKKFITVSDGRVQDFLRHLYIENVHEECYDELVPYLFKRGFFTLAHRWRDILRDKNDGPMSEASRAYLRFRAAYCQDEPMTESEVRAAGFDPQGSDEMITLKKEACGEYRVEYVQMGFSHSSRNNRTHDVQYLINRVHGELYGIDEKQYDDALGARVFASHWLSIESTIHAIETLGLNSIGPLSLQSIALREKLSSRITHRIEQLAASGISITESSYTRALRSFAADGDQELLDLLLQSDIHPDVFDDISTQLEILKADAKTGNWEQYELIMAVRLAVSRSVVAAFSDKLLGISLKEDKRGLALRILDFCARPGEVPHLSEHTVEVVAQHFMDRVSPNDWHEAPREGFNLFQSALLKRTLPGPYPLPAWAARRILFRLGSASHFDELVLVCKMLARRYHGIMTSEQHQMTYLHKADVPTLLHGESGSNYLAVPRDLEISNPIHPVRQIFTVNLQRSIVRWGFRLFRYRKRRMDTPHAVEHMEPKHFHYAWGIRLLAILRDHGVAIDQEAVAAQVMLRIAEQFWSGRLHNLYGVLLRVSGAVQPAERAVFVLNEVFNTCEEAWHTVVSPEGGQREPVKPLLDRDKLMTAVQQWGRHWKKRKPDIFVTFMSHRLARRRSAKLKPRHKRRFLYRRHRVCVLGRLPDPRYGQSI